MVTICLIIDKQWHSSENKRGQLLPSSYLQRYFLFTLCHRSASTLQQVAPPLLLIDGKMAADSDMDHDMELLSDEELERYCT